MLSREEQTELRRRCLFVTSCDYFVSGLVPGAPSFLPDCETVRRGGLLALRPSPRGERGGGGGGRTAKDLDKLALK